MTVHDDILAELSKGPRTFTYLERKCSRPNLPPDHVLKTVARMVSSKEIVVREWVVEKGKFTPVYERRNHLNREEDRTGMSAGGWVVRPGEICAAYNGNGMVRVYTRTAPEDLMDEWPETSTEVEREAAEELGWALYDWLEDKKDREGRRWSIKESAFVSGYPLVQIGGECIVVDGTDHVCYLAGTLLDAASEAEKDVRKDDSS